MILIQRGKEPDSLLKYRKSFPKACYEELPAEPIKDIREQMWAEQKGLCAYCMCKLNSPQDVRIEHYAARNPEDGSMMLPVLWITRICWQYALAIAYNQVQRKKTELVMRIVETRC